MSTDKKKEGKKVGILVIIVVGLMLLLSLCEFVTCVSGNPLPVWEKKSSNY